MTDLEAKIREEYAPYHVFAEFQIGWTDWKNGRTRNPFGDSVAGQSWDRGAEAQMRYQRALDRR